MIVIHFHPMWNSHSRKYPCRIISILFTKMVITFTMRSNIFNKSWYFVMIFILPWMSTPPMTVETALNFSHLLPYSMLCIRLHSGIYSRIDLESTGIYINIWMVFTELGKIWRSSHIVNHFFPKIESPSIIIFFHTKIQLDWLLAHLLILRVRNVMELTQIGKHRIPS